MTMLILQKVHFSNNINSQTRLLYCELLWIYNNFLYRSLSKNEILASEKRAEEISKEIYDHQIAISEMEEALIEIELEEARNPIPLKDRGFFGF